MTRASVNARKACAARLGTWLRFLLMLGSLAHDVANQLPRRVRLCSDLRIDLVSLEFLHVAFDRLVPSLRLFLCLWMRGPY